MFGEKERWPALNVEQQQLVEQNKGLAWMVVNSLPRTHPARRMGKETIEQEALLGLCQAAASFDPQYGAAFSTYAVVCIRNRIGKASYFWAGYDSEKQGGAVRLMHGSLGSGDPEDATNPHTIDAPDERQLPPHVIPDALDELESVRHHFRPREWRVLWEVVGKGRSFAEVAQDEGVSWNRIEQALRTAEAMILIIRRQRQGLPTPQTRSRAALLKWVRRVNPKRRGGPQLYQRRKVCIPKRKAVTA